jgi:UDP-N-acetylglucosamine acyltransferase
MSNFIHKTATVDNTVKLGIGNYIGPYCFITGDTVIGDNNRFEGYCSVGTPPEHKEYFNFKNGKTIIGNNNTFREFITINAGIVESSTLEDNVVMLRNSHISHSSTV